LIDSHDIKSAATIPPVILPPPAASYPSTVFKTSPNVNTLPLCHDAHHVTPDMPHTIVDTTISLKDTLMQQLQILHQMSVITAKLCELLDLTFGVLATPNSATSPNTCSASASSAKDEPNGAFSTPPTLTPAPPTDKNLCLYALHPINFFQKIQQSPWILTMNPHSLQPAPTQKTIHRPRKNMTTINPPAICGCQALSRTKDYLCLP